MSARACLCVCVCVCVCLENNIEIALNKENNITVYNLIFNKL